MTPVKLIEVSELTITVGSCDLLDGTPVLDIKPYIPSIDSFPEASTGWVGELERELACTPLYSVALSPLAEEQLLWLSQKWGIEILERAKAILERDPTPHRSRRIVRVDENRYRMGCGAWRLFYSLQENQVTIERVARGYLEQALLSSEYSRIPDRQAQLSFGRLWAPH